VTDKASGVIAFVKRAVREPLVHFLAIGLALFVINGLVHGPDQGAAGDSIVISKGRVNQIVQSYVLLSGHLPTTAELQTLVDDFVSEEVGYREAVAMGLDADDTIVRRRMRQKLEFLIEDGAASTDPTEAELQAWMTAHADKYRLPERRALRQVLLSSDKRGGRTLADAAATLTSLARGADPAKLGDPSMLPAALPPTTQESIAGLFGAEFAAKVFAHAGHAQGANDWFGPVASPFGQHIVSVITIEPARTVALSEAIDNVRADWVEARRNDARDDFHARLRKRYNIRIEWPEPWTNLPETPNPTPKTKPIPEVGE
jgi:hypothetical protein